MPILWNRDPTSIAAKTTKSRLIPKGPLLNLVELQACLSDGRINPNDDNQFWKATDRCQAYLEKYSWTHDDIAQMICNLLPGKFPKGDYKKSEWCTLENGDEAPCDVYGLGWDETNKKRNRNALEIYLKFSLSQDGVLCLILVQAHLS